MSTASATTEDANLEIDYTTQYSECNNLKGTMCDIYGYPIPSSDYSTIDIKPDDPTYQAVVSPNLDENGDIKDNSELSFISRRNRKRYNTIHADSNSNIDSNKRGSVIYNVYLNKQKKPKKKMYFESVEVKKKKVNDLEYAQLYNSLLTKVKKEELIIPKVPENKRRSLQLNNIFRFNKNKISDEQLRMNN